jgi:mannose PTS system EIID component
MNRRLQALLRLFAVQGTWNYERMLGVGMGYAAEPLLEDLKTIDPVRHGEAVVRSAEFFNCNPNLAGLALGATTRAEYEGIPGSQIVRLRTALCSPLGSMGDQLFWAGLVPTLVGFTVVAAVLGAGGWAVVFLLLAYNTIRIWTGYWSLQTGMAAGMQVGAAIGSSWLPRAIEWAGPAAGFALGMAVPLVAGWYLTAFGWGGVLGASGVAVAGFALIRWFGPGLTSIRFAIMAMILLLLFRRLGL